MKKFTKLRKSTILVVFAIFLMCSGAFAQSPNSFKYQAVLRDLDGKVKTNQAMEVEIAILQGTETGTAVLTELFSVSTNKFGLVNLEIGSVDPSNFAAIDWGNGPYFIKISVDGDAVGTSQLLSVPYALHAGTADNVADADADPTNELQDITLVGNTLSLTMGSSVVLTDVDSTNELQMLSISGNELSLSNGNTVSLAANNFDLNYSSLIGVPTKVSDFINDAAFISNPNDADADASNELQTLSVSGNELTISDGNTVTLAGNDFDGKYSSLTGAPSHVSDFTNDAGFITNADDADADASNELQNLSIVNKTISLSDGGDVVLPDEMDPEFNAWDKSTGVAITESQITDLQSYISTEVDGSVTNELQIISVSNDTIFLSDGGFVKLPSEIDPVYSAWDKTTGISITESQISDLSHFSNADETDPVFNTWDKSSGIAIMESQITDLTHFTNADEMDQVWNAQKGDYSTALEVAALPISTFTNDAGYLTSATAETDPVFGAWDKSTGIAITESQISDLQSYLSAEVDGSVTNELQLISLSNDTIYLSDGGFVKLMAETDPIYAAWDKSTGISINESQISDLAHFTTADETDPVYAAWDKSTGISISESQIIDLAHFTTADETDPVFTAWDKSTGISITESQISDLDHFTNSDETDQVFTAWDKSTGILISESQITDLDHFTNSDETDQVFEASLAAGITAADTTWWGRKDFLMDTDSDTKIQVEKNIDEDKIHFDLAGTEQWVMTGSRLEAKNSGNSVFIGFNAGLVDDLSANSNVFIGDFAAQLNTSGDYNTAVGTNALSLNTIGAQNTAIGKSALQKNVVGVNNTANGFNALYSAIGDYNTAVGHSALSGDFTAGSAGDYNTAIGYQSLYSYTVGNDNAAIGNQALFSNKGGDFNVGLGTRANFFNENGNSNIAIGYEAGRGISSNDKSNNVFIGHQAGYSAGNGDNANIFIGYQAGYSETASNKLFIENTNSATPLIYGEFDNDLLRFNGTVEVANGASIKLFETGNTFFTSFQSQAQASNINYTLPAADGIAGQVLQTNGAGGLSWEDDGVTSPVAITSGTINGTTSVDLSAGTLTLADDQISGDKVEGGTIGTVGITTANIATATISSALNIPIVIIANDPSTTGYAGLAGDLVCFNNGTTGQYELWINTDGTPTGWAHMQ